MKLKHLKKKVSWEFFRGYMLAHARFFQFVDHHDVCVFSYVLNDHTTRVKITKSKYTL